jgi:putative hemolysin
MIPGSTAGLGKLFSFTFLPGVGILTWWTVGSTVGQVTSPTSDSAPVILVILGILCLILLNSLFVMGSVAIESIRPFLIRHSKDHDEAGYRRLERLMDEKAGYVAAATVGSHLCRIGIIGGSFLMADDLAVVIFPHSGTTVGFLQLLSAALIIAIPAEIINLIVGELVPKSIASLHPIRTATRLYGFLTASRSVLVLFTFPVEAVANAIARRFGGTATFSMPNQTEEEIKNLVESAEQSGEIERDERELLHSVFSFTDTIAREVMTPRVDLDAVAADTPATELVQLIKESGHSRIPIYEGTDDQIVGIIHAKDLLMAMLSEKPVSIRGLMRAPYFVPENKNLQQLLSELRTNRAQMAIIQDEFGGTSGIVTIEDIVEELVGDIVDEYDEEEPSVLAKDNGWSVEGRTHWEDLNRAIGSEFESDEFDTIGGYVFGLFGRQPSAGETMDVDGWRFTITETDGRRISRLHVGMIPPETEEPATADLAYG